MHVYNVALSLAVASATISSSNASDHASAGIVQPGMTGDVLSTNADRKLGKSSKSSKGSKGGNVNRAGGSSSKSSKGNKSGNVNRAGGDDSSSSKSKKKKKRSNNKKNRAKKNKDTAKREPVIVNKADNSETDGDGVIANKAAATPSPTEAPSKAPVAATPSPTEAPSKTPTPSPTEAPSKTPTVPLGAVDSYTFTATTFAPTFKPTNTPTVPPSESPVTSLKSDLNANTYQCFYEQGINICFTYNDDQTCEMSIENRDCSCCLYTDINHPVIMSFDCTNLGPEWGGMGACLSPDTRAAELNFPSEDGI